MAHEGEEVHPQLPRLHRNLADGLRRVRVHRGAARPGEVGDLADRLDDPLAARGGGARVCAVRVEAGRPAGRG